MDDHEHSEYAQVRDLDTLERRIADLESQVRVLTAAVEGIADQHV
jgi:hypothetical protein